MWSVFGFLFFRLQGFSIFCWQFLVLDVSFLSRCQFGLVHGIFRCDCPWTEPSDKIFPRPVMWLRVRHCSSKLQQIVRWFCSLVTRRDVTWKCHYCSCQHIASSTLVTWCCLLHCNFIFYSMPTSALRRSSSVWAIRPAAWGSHTLDMRRSGYPTPGGATGPGLRLQGIFH